MITRGNETDEQALLHFKAKITDDPAEIFNFWNSSTHFCQWYGVTCGRRHRRVVSLNLSSLQLGGLISPHVGNLSFLRVLHVQQNSFGQEIPSEIRRLRRLEDLRLNNNNLSGIIPSNLSALSNLKYLVMGHNQLVGEIPETLGFLSKLEFLAINHNILTGTIPSSIGNLSSLQTLYLGDNLLSGSIPDSLGRLTNLTDFLMSTNKLSGSIPLSLLNVSSMGRFDVADNRIQGSLPSNLGFTLPNIRAFSIALNDGISGSLPISISNASKLELLQVAANNLTGEVPSLENLHRIQVFRIGLNFLGKGELNDLNFICTLTNASDLLFLDINVNNFGGILPECIGNLSTNLEEMSVDHNKIIGNIPSGLENLVNLVSLDMWNNQFTGNIPPGIGKLRKLIRLQLQLNKLSGTIPESIGNLTLLSELYLQGNNLQGRIPESLGNCKNLILLTLNHNNLSGNIPTQILSLSSLSVYLDLQRNQLTGNLPSEVGILRNLGLLSIANNMLSGEIPSSLGNCIKLETLDLSGNSFEGNIPSSLSSLRGLQSLDFSRNNLSGKIPEFLASFDLLLSLNLSFNDFEGRVPTTGVFENASATAIMGNQKLCGGIPEFRLSLCNLRVEESKKLSTILKIIIASASGIFGLSFTFILWYCFYRKKKQKLVLPSSPSIGNSHFRVTYKDLHDATNGFSSENLVGTGSFGSVYKGILEKEGLVIAVKVLNLQLQKASKSFFAECEALKSIRHRNLVKILTSCSSIDYQGNNFMALVYEFMVNGSLEERLHPNEQHAEASTSLNLLQRLNISIDIASALQYLHHHCESSIVHCDLKPSNILLDIELNGHISDFGLAKILSGTLSDHTIQSSSLGLRGTIGYAPPEYGLGSEASTSGDVYSYGILLLEIFTGKRPTNGMFKEDWNIHELGRSALPNGVMEILDPILLQEKFEGSIIVDCFASIIEIGVACSARLPTDRMIITDVVSELCAIRKKIIEADLY
ncbi:probable LRR receptor-like serine/threonine-protein kinase At3g47570 [Mercurialis annua]|uniref:probable LRR receptor-like serine/threonine-protein kinase At3g47570 n=1 Tax=Mercurialis annua TaxID=3986 RepID=UPI00215E008A|nr:probable LRR receptor-like serine/threonine-protein kinase At3g47570 [Mercurialis annua]